MIVDDFKGDTWDLRYHATQINKCNGCTYVFWRVVRGPQEMHLYGMIWTPIFTDWWR